MILTFPVFAQEQESKATQSVKPILCFPYEEVKKNLNNLKLLARGNSKTNDNKILISDVYLNALNNIIVIEYMIDPVARTHSNLACITLMPDNLEWNKSTVSNIDTQINGRKI